MKKIVMTKVVQVTSLVCLFPLPGFRSFFHTFLVDLKFSEALGTHPVLHAASSLLLPNRDNTKKMPPPPFSVPSLSPHFWGQSNFWITSTQAWSKQQRRLPGFLLLSSMVSVQSLLRICTISLRKGRKTPQAFQHSRQNLILPCLHVFTSAWPSSPCNVVPCHTSLHGPNTLFSIHGSHSLSLILEYWAPLESNPSQAF